MLVLWKYQNGHLARLKKKKIQFTEIKQDLYRNKKDYKRLLWTIAYQQIGLARWNKFLEIHNLPRQTWRIRNLNPPLTSKNLNQYSKTSQQKSQDPLVSLNSTQCLKN